MAKGNQSRANAPAPAAAPKADATETRGLKELADAAKAVFEQNAVNLKEFVRTEAHRREVTDAMEKNAHAARNQEA